MVAYLPCLKARGFSLYSHELKLEVLEWLTMSSIEIAKLTEKEHYHVTRDIEKMLKDLWIATTRFGCTYKDSQNKEQKMYLLDKRLSLTLVAWYNAKLRLAIIDRRQELEKKELPQLPTTYLEALKALVIKTEELELADKKLSLISRTKKTYTASELGKEMWMRSAQEFNKWFSKYQYKRNDTWLLRAEYSGKWYDSIKTWISQNWHTFHNLEFTQLGRERVLKLYTDEISAQYTLN